VSIATSRSASRATSRAGPAGASPQSAAISTAAAASTALGARNGERASFVGPAHATCALGAVEARALGGARRLVAELGVTHAARKDGQEQVPRDAVCEELVVGKNR